MTQHDIPRPPSQLNRMMSLLRVGPRAIALRFYDQAQRKLTGAPVWKLSKITPNVYVGGQHTPKGWAEMQREGISAIVNMREAHKDDAPKGIASDHYLHLATVDNTPPSLDDLARGVAFITEQVAQGRKVYVHCGLGVGRAPSQVGAYLISTGMTTDEAIIWIKSVRPFIHLTRRQYQQLRAFEARTRAKKKK